MFLFEEEDSLYEWISCLIPDRFYYGPFPNQRMMNRLLRDGFNVIVNLTHPGEQELYRIPLSPPGFPERSMEILSYPIDDHHIPSSPETYCRLITTIKDRYLSGKKIYLHCRGGHGRSSMVAVSAIYSIYHSYEFHHAISYVNECHLLRANLRNKWKKRKSPFNAVQYQFLAKMHKNIYLNYIDTTRNHYYDWLIYTEPILVLDDGIEYTYNLLELFDEPCLTADQKGMILRRFLERKLLKFIPKLRLTYLKKFVIADCQEGIQRFYDSILSDIRERWCGYLE